MTNIQNAQTYLELAKVNAEVAKLETRNPERRLDYIAVAKEYARKAIEELDRAEALVGTSSAAQDDANRKWNASCDITNKTR